MLKNFLLSSIRNLLRNRVYTAINIIGLVVALASCFTIVLFIQSESGMDQFHPDGTHTHLMTLTLNSESGSREVGLSGVSTRDWVAENNPEIASTTLIRGIGAFALRHEDKTLEDRKLTLAEPNFFDYFNFELIRGDKTTALENPNSIILSEHAAKQFFGEEDPIGKIISTVGELELNLQVTGVIVQNPKSHLEYDCIISWKSQMPNGQIFADGYNRSVYTYVKTSAPMNPQELSTRISERYQEEFPEENMELVFYPLTDIYFSTNHVEFMLGFRSGNKQSLYIMTAVVILLLVISLINYINISISMSLKRMKEIGVRKVMGATPWQLKSQFLVESLIVVGVSAVLAATLADIIVYVISAYFDISISARPFSNLPILITLAGISLTTALIAGMYPSLFISRVKPSLSLRNQISKGSKKQTVRKMLIGFQFVVTVGLMVMAFMVYEQQVYTQTKPLGFSKDEVLVLPIGNSAELTEHRISFLNEIDQISGVLSSSISTDALGGGSTNNSWYAATEEMNDVQKEGVMSTYFGIDSDFIPTYKLNILEGRNFVPNRSSDSSAVIINETLAQRLGLTSPIGQRIKLFGKDSRRLTIIGVVADFNFQSLHKLVAPTAMYITRRNFWNVAVRFDPQQLATVLPAISNVWEKFEQEVPFKYAFLNERLEQFYEKDTRFSRIISIFALISILLSLIGLFGLTAFTVEQRLKEISIRKVLGANVREILLLMNKDMTLLFLLTLLISLPVSFMLVEKWLENFAYHIPNNWTVYVISAMITLALIVLAVGLTALKAAYANPVDYLRNE